METKMPLNSYIKQAFENAKAEAKDFTFKTAGTDVMIYPCGFAWVYLKVRKNSSFGETLAKLELMDWDNYSKHYKYWVGDFNQSMSHKEVFAEKFAELLTEEFGMEFRTGSRMD